MVDVLDRAFPNQKRNGMDSPEKQQAEGNWTQFTGRLKEAWGALTDNDLDRFEGKRDQLAGCIQEATGESREVVERELSRIAAEINYDI